jgi:hypothetical protein
MNARMLDGTTDFSGGIDSGRIPTIQGPQNPNGLRRSMNAWLGNGHCRGGGLNPRNGWKKLCTVRPAGAGLYQGGYLYQPDAANPYLMLDVAGRTYRIRVDTDNSVQDVTVIAPNPAGEPQHWFVQAENYLIIQDGISVPRVWDGTTMRLITAMGGAAPYLPTGQAMCYYMGRVWVANGREYMAGDIVLGPSGTGNAVTAPFLRDAVLHASENIYLTGGGKFVIPSTAGNIRALNYNANLDTALGQGQLFVFTRQQVFATSVPAQRTEWINLSEPLQRVAQINFGTTSDRSIVQVNGDLFFQSMDGVRSLMLAVRNFQQWGNTPISRNENRVIKFNDRSLLRYGSGVSFDNRLLETVLPFQTPFGVAHRGIMPLDFDLISSLEEKLPPAWEGMLEGVDVMQMFSGDFGGLERCFGVIVSRLTGDLEVWEFTLFDREDNPGFSPATTTRVQWFFETPAFTGGDSFQFKELETVEFWIDKLIGTVDFTLEYRPDSWPCWIMWHAWRECSAADTCEDFEFPVCYPSQPFCESFRATRTMPKPPIQCIGPSNRPSNLGFQFQLRLTVHGACRIRGLLMHMLTKDRPKFDQLVCTDQGSGLNQ